jgi:hypothetical protein
MKNTQTKKNQQLVDEGKKALDELCVLVNRRYEAEKTGVHGTRFQYKKLIVGLLMLSLTSWLLIFFCQNDNMWRFERLTQGFFNSMIPALSGLLSPLVCMIVAFSLVRYWITGFYKISTWKFHNSIFENSNTKQSILLDLFTRTWEMPTSGQSNLNLSNVDSLISYRDSKMSSMSYEQRANLLARTSVLDAARSGILSGKNAQDTISYMNSALAGKSYEGGLDYISGKK